MELSLKWALVKNKLSIFNMKKLDQLEWKYINFIIKFEMSIIMFAIVFLILYYVFYKK